ncbi:hypothetical protein RJ640_009856 [Escallonia rubra]|uniref:THIF-type NAD/FAD binding fold domain-containing protein n=1 Tax=Escallonia rubra TaxID=112253 RepID=A0AA88R435_9ASTE|nr:hypothetical protein RJ640_009856 [Escallonia rubra]
MALGFSSLLTAFAANRKNPMEEQWAKDMAIGDGAETAKEKRKRWSSMNENDIETIDDIDQILSHNECLLEGNGVEGCGPLKNVALMGVSLGDGGKQMVTDDNVIEKNIQNRRFIFRDCKIGQAKSTVAASAASLINPHLHIEALASPETENMFDDTFSDNLGVVINALDNVNARLYVDHRCL